MAVDLSQQIPSWTDGVDHWRQIDVSWLRDRSVLRLIDRTVLGASSANAGQVIYSGVDQALYLSALVGAAYNWKGILAASKLVIDETGTDPELRLVTSGAGSGVSWKAGSTISVTNLQVAGAATINGLLTAASIVSNSTLNVTTNLTVGGSATVAGNLAVTGTITAAGITGSSSTAARLATPRSISLIGDASGATLFDGSAGVAITVTLVNKSSAATANSLVVRDVSGGASFGPVSTGALTATSLTIPGAGTIQIDGAITGGSIVNCNQVNVVNSVQASFITVTNAVTANRGGASSDWSSAHFVASATGGSAAIALHTISYAVQLRLGTSVNDLYFRNTNDSGFVNIQAAAFITGSSTRYKDKIEPLDIDALSIVRQLAPVSWLQKDPADKRTHIGFTAEALSEVFPVAVVRDEQGRPDAIESNAIDTLSLVATRQLLDRMEALEAKVSKLSGVAS